MSVGWNSWMAGRVRPAGLVVDRAVRALAHGAGVVRESHWVALFSRYDKDNSGALDKEETKQFVKDTLKEMADGDDNDEFNEEDFNKCFEEFDKDGSGTIEKDEMALFIKKVAGL